MPIFYANVAGRFHAKTDWRRLVKRLTASDVSTNLGYVRDYLQFQCPNTRSTLCAGVFLLRAGEALTVDDNGELRTRYVAPPRPGPAPWRSILEDLLSDSRIERSVFHLSSGLDSPLLVAMASKLHGTRVKAITCRTRGRGCPEELETVERLSDDLGCDLTVYDFTDIDVFEKGAALARALGYPIGHPSHLVEYLLDEQCGSGARIVTGHGPDEALGGYEWHREGFSDSSRHIERTRVTSPEIVATLIGGSSRSVDGLEPWRGKASLSLMDRLVHDLRSISEAWRLIHAAHARHLEVEIVSPFNDPRIQAAFLALPDAEKARNGVQKWCLRQAAAEVCPDYLLRAPKRVLRLDFQPYLRDYDASELMRILFTTSDFAQRYVSHESIKTLIEETLQLRANWGWQLWSLYLCSQAHAFLTSTGVDET